MRHQDTTRTDQKVQKREIVEEVGTATGKTAEEAATIVSFEEGGDEIGLSARYGPRALGIDERLSLEAESHLEADIEAVDLDLVPPDEVDAVVREAVLDVEVGDVDEIDQAALHLIPRGADPGRRGGRFECEICGRMKREPSPLETERNVCEDCID